MSIGGLSMSRLLRIFGYLVCLIQLFAGLAFAAGWEPIIQLWPFRYDAAYTGTGADELQAAAEPTADYSFMVLGSIYIAAAASTFWALISRENVAFSGVAIDYVLIFLPVGIYAFQNVRYNTSLQLFGVISNFMIIIGVLLFRATAGEPIHDKTPTPAPVRIAFSIFTIALLIAGGALVLKTPNILPWEVSTGIGVVYGWMFLGAGGYFAYGVLRPFWRANAAGQLAGFLAYDIVLIVPFLNYLATVPDRWRANLIIYLIVLISSGLLAIYYLFVSPATRVIRPAVPQRQPA